MGFALAPHTDLTVRAGRQRGPSGAVVAALFGRAVHAAPGAGRADERRCVFVHADAGVAAGALAAGFDGDKAERCAFASLYIVALATRFARHARRCWSGPCSADALVAPLVVAAGQGGPCAAALARPGGSVVQAPDVVGPAGGGWLVGHAALVHAEFAVLAVAAVHALNADARLLVAHLTFPPARVARIACFAAFSLSADFTASALVTLRALR